jgi:hypothetical protein
LAMDGSTALMLLHVALNCEKGMGVRVGVGGGGVGWDGGGACVCVYVRKKAILVQA